MDSMTSDVGQETGNEVCLAVLIKVGSGNTHIFLVRSAPKETSWNVFHATTYFRSASQLTAVLLLYGPHLRI